MHNILGYIESIVTIIAIIIGGIWTYVLFIKNREKYPKAKINHQIEEVTISEEILIRLKIEIINLGKVKLPIKSGEVRLQQIKPLTTTISKAIDNFKKDENEKKGDIEWSLLEERILKYEEDEVYELEPGEKDFFEFDFTINQEIEVIQIYTHIENIF